MPRVLFVDDEHSVRSAGKVQLTIAGNQVETASGAEEAEGKLREQEFDVVVTDMRMVDEEAGLVVLKAAKEASPETEVIVLTAYGKLENAARAMELGAYSYVLKLGDVQGTDEWVELCEKVRLAAERKQLRGEARQREEELRQERDRAIRLEERDVARQQRLENLKLLSFKGAHKIGNALAGLSLQVSLLARMTKAERCAPALLQEIAADIGDSVKDAGALVQRFKYFAQPVELRPEPTDVRRLLEGVAAKWPGRESGVAIRVQVEEDVPPVDLDRARMTEALSELVHNAIRALQAADVREPRIDINASAIGECVELSVEDNGLGVPDEKKEVIFQPFTTFVGDGTGLGLAIVREVFQAHGGSIVERGTTGKGALFVGRVPIRSSNAQSADPTPRGTQAWCPTG